MRTGVVSFHTHFVRDGEQLVLDVNQEVANVQHSGGAGAHYVTVASYSTEKLVRTAEGNLITESQARAAELAAKTVV